MLPQSLTKYLNHPKAAKKSAKKAKKEAALKTPEKSAEEPTPSKEKVSFLYHSSTFYTFPIVHN